MCSIYISVEFRPLRLPKLADSVKRDDWRLCLINGFNLLVTLYTMAIHLIMSITS
jgi:hypothetical protein